MIGVFGGSFNPIHNGHLLLAEIIREEFGLEKVLFVPSGNPPHKQQEELADPQHRYNMVQIAIAGNPFFEVSNIEIHRSDITYTFDTLERINEAYPDKRLGFICGADSIVNLTTWRNIGRIFELADLLVAGRPNIPQDEYRNMVCMFEDRYGAKIRQANTPLIEISSTQIRERLKNGLSIRYMVPDEVFRYIQLYKLYLA